MFVTAMGDGGGAVRRGDLGEGEGVGDRPRLRAAVVRRDVHGEEPEGAEAPDDLRRESTAPIVLGGRRRHDLAREAAGRVAHPPLQVVRLEVHQSLSTAAEITSRWISLVPS
jgi:hypothetical protein